MITRNQAGILHSGASASAITAYEAALRGYQQFTGDPVALLNQAIEDSPNFVMAHVARAYLCLIGSDPAPREMAAAGLPALQQMKANATEKLHIEAVARLVRGEWRSATRLLEDIAIDQPYDILAIQTGHLLDLMLGETRMLRDRPARALRYWSKETPGYSALLGMHAFGLEETGDYTRAEAAGRAAIDIDPRDSWAQHAVAHVLEMQGRTSDGLKWMLEGHERWSKDNFFHVHNWWHTAMYHYEQESYADVFKLWDGPIYGARSEIVFDMIDASAMLWRLQLRGQDVGDRWEKLADNWEKVAADTRFSFNDAHAMMAFVSAGRDQAIDKLRRGQEAAANLPGDYHDTLRTAGRAISEGFIAFGEGDYARSVQFLRNVRPVAIRFGGSHAQRDIIDLTLIEAALRSGEMSLARALTAERAEVRPDLISNQKLVRRALAEKSRHAA